MHHARSKCRAWFARGQFPRGRAWSFNALVLAAMLVAIVVAFGARADAPRRVLWITIDSLRADHLHYMGYAKETSPWLDTFAEEAVDFRLAIAPSNVTRRSVAAYMTGKYGLQLLHEEPPLHIPMGETTAAELFGSAGYRTLAWVTPSKLVKGAGFEQGFDKYYVLLPHRAPSASIDEVIEHVRRAYTPSQGNEFIYIHTMDVHLPYRPPIPYDRLFAPAYDRGVVREGAIFDRRGHYAICNFPYFSHTHDIQPLDIEFLMSQYDGAIRYTDAKLPELLEALRYDPGNDLVIITADHGQQFFEHGYWSHGKLLFPEEIHVPLLLRHPDFKAGRRSKAVSMMDLWPTFADLLGAPHPSGLAGVSLLRVLHGEAQPLRFAISEHQHPCIPAAAVVGEGYFYRVMGMAHFRYPWRLWPFIEELYDLNADPGCTQNLALRMVETANRFNTILREQDPRYREFSPELIRGPDAAVRFGPNLLEAISPKPLRWTVSPGQVGTISPGEVKLAVPEAQTYAKATVAEPGHAHLLEVTYQLRSGEVVFKLQNKLTNVLARVSLESLPADDDVAWHYESYRPTAGVQIVRSVVYPTSPETYFIAALPTPGEVIIKSVQLRRAFVPELEAEFKLPPREQRSLGPRLSPEDRARMTALGYLDD